jgi:putative sugar O-methyltransferase
MDKLAVNPAIAQRLMAFIGSDTFALRSSVAKSEYWKYFSEQLHARISGSSVEIAGASGFYVPRDASRLKRGTRRIMRGLKQPGNAIRKVGDLMAARFEVPRLMSCEDAFDAVMTHAEVSIPVLSPYTINHRKLAQHPMVFASSSSVKRHYRSWSGYEASANIVNHYYYQNILRGFQNAGQLGTVMEIGAGNGNFPSILYHDWPPARIVLVDLPETLAVAIPYLSSLFPKAKMAMPNEIQADGFPAEYDFAFLTPDQLALIADDSIDLALNCHSFQEMTHQQIEIYIRLVQRVCRDSALFFTANRVEKIPCGAEPFSVEQNDPPNRAAEYPWTPGNKVLVNEISKLSRLVQLDGVSIRLERISKVAG